MKDPLPGVAESIGYIRGTLARDAGAMIPSRPANDDQIGIVPIHAQAGRRLLREFSMGSHLRHDRVRASRPPRRGSGASCRSRNRSKWIPHEHRIVVAVLGADDPAEHGPFHDHALTGREIEGQADGLPDRDRISASQTDASEAHVERAGWRRGRTVQWGHDDFSEERHPFEASRGLCLELLCPIADQRFIPP